MALQWHRPACALGICNLFLSLQMHKCPIILKLIPTEILHMCTILDCDHKKHSAMHGCKFVTRGNKVR